jgi:hypothetical protein
MEHGKMKMLSKNEIQKGSNKLKREISRLPFLSSINERVYQKRVDQYSQSLPPISGQEQEIVNSLNQNGMFSIHTSELAVPKTVEAIQAAKRLLADPISCKGDQDKNWIPAHILNQQPDLLLWALDERLLDIAENYIKLPIYYLGVEVRQEFSNGKENGVRQWHIDTEDHRMMKIIIYLNDVDLGGGPFEYISKDLTQQATKSLKYHSGLVPDATMSQAVSPSDWVAAVGEEGTAVFVDPCNIFHRAKPPAQRDRFSITYHYTSQYPLEFRNPNIFSDQPFVRDRLTERQLKCLVWR